MSNQVASRSIAIYLIFEFQNGRGSFMKYLLALMVLSSVCFSDTDGNMGMQSVITESGSDAFSLTLIDDWTLSGKALGLDIYDGASDYVLGADNNLDVIQAYEVGTGAIAGTLDLYTDNDACFGIAWNLEPDPDDEYVTNDWVNPVLYHTDDFGTSWDTFSNPASSSGRGMDYYDGYYWETNTSGQSVYRFQLGGSFQEFSVPEVPLYLSGITVIPSGGDIYLLIASYNSTSAYLYYYDGSTLSYEGSATFPVASMANSFGLAYYEVSGTLYWSYKDNSDNYHLTQLGMSGLSLESTTWGSIKNSF